jgi:hypothetical protein
MKASRILIHSIKVMKKVYHLFKVTSKIQFQGAYVLPGHAVAYLVEALCYKQEGRGFESR